jgi:hypothetical protein
VSEAKLEALGENAGGFCFGGIFPETPGRATDNRDWYTADHEGQTLTQDWHRRRWALVAAIAIVIALAALLVPHASSGDAGAWLAVLPLLLFVGVISPLSLLSPMAYMYLGRTSGAPVLPAIFQRPPPIRLV